MGAGLLYAGFQVGKALFGAITAANRPGFKISREQQAGLDRLKKISNEGILGKEGLAEQKNRSSRAIALGENNQIAGLQGRAIAGGVNPGSLSTTGHINKVQNLGTQTRVDTFQDIEARNDATKAPAALQYSQAVGEIDRLRYADDVARHEGVTQALGGILDVGATLLGRQIAKTDAKELAEDVEGRSIRANTRAEKRVIATEDRAAVRAAEAEQKALLKATWWTKFTNPDDFNALSPEDWEAIYDKMDPDKIIEFTKYLEGLDSQSPNQRFPQLPPLTQPGGIGLRYGSSTYNNPLYNVGGR
jgi:hypothetical protein